jgi:putative membrane protein
MMRGYWGHPGNGTFGHHFGGMGIAGMVLMIILWVAVIAAIVLVIRALVLHSRHHRLASTTAPVAPTGTMYAPGLAPGPAAAPSALLAILEERYARGEINREEFFQRRQDLGLSGSSVAPPTETPPAS